MVDTNDTGPVGVDKLGKSVAELVSMGCKFVVEGDVFSCINELLEKLVLDGAADTEGVRFLLQLRAALLTTSKPVVMKGKLFADKDNVIEIASTMPKAKPSA